MIQVTSPQEMQEKIYQIVNSKFLETVLDFDTNLIEIGMDSLIFIELIVELENELEIEFDANDLLFEEFSTIRAIHKKIIGFKSFAN